METRTRRLPGLVAVPVVVTAALLGLALAVLGWSGWFLGPAVLVLAMVGRSAGARWADWALLAGLGLVVGTATYLLLGVLGSPGEPARGSGSGNAVAREVGDPPR